MDRIKERDFEKKHKSYSFSHWKEKRMSRESVGGGDFVKDSTKSKRVLF